MGGNALSEPSVRLSKEEYFPLHNQVVDVLDRLMPGIPKYLIEAYGDKPTFGDMDIIMPSVRDFDPALIAETLGATDWVTSKEVSSFGLKVESGVFQLDLLCVPPESVDFARNYYAMNDLGNLMGAASRKAGFKFGHLGLFYLIPDEKGGKRGELCVTKSWKDALSLLDYDAEAHRVGLEGGFRTLTDVFAFAVSSRFFEPSYFLGAEKHNAKARARAAKRSTNQEFVRWIQSDQGRSTIRPRSLSDDQVARELFCNAKLRFPDFSTALGKFFADEAAAAMAAKRAILYRKKLKEALRPLTSSLSGVALGERMTVLKQRFAGAEEMKEWVLGATAMELSEWVGSADEMPR